LAGWHSLGQFGGGKFSKEQNFQSVSMWLKNRAGVQAGRMSLTQRRLKASHRLEASCHDSSVCWKAPRPRSPQSGSPWTSTSSSSSPKRTEAPISQWSIQCSIELMWKMMRHFCMRSR
jgi:hypothetical protein